MGPEKITTPTFNNKYFYKTYVFYFSLRFFFRNQQRQIDGMQGKRCVLSLINSIASRLQHLFEDCRELWSLLLLENSGDIFPVYRVHLVRRMQN